MRPSDAVHRRTWQLKVNRKLDFGAFKAALGLLATTKYPELPASGTCSVSCTVAAACERTHRAAPTLASPALPRRRPSLSHDQ